MKSTRALPDGWQWIQPRRHFRDRREPSRSTDVHLTPSQHHGVLSQADYMAKAGSRVVLNLVGGDSMKHVEPGDFIAHLRSFQGGLETSELIGKVSSAYTVIEPLSDIDSRFYRWVFKSTAFVQGLAAGVQQLRDGQSIKFGDFASIELPQPPVDEQRRIADFLDDRVSRIDRIIAARREQVRLLDSHYMAWLQEEINDLGRVHGWTTLRRLGLKVEQGWSPLADSVPASSGEPGVLKLGAVRGGTFDPGENKAFLAGAVPKGEYLLKKGDLLITRANTPNLVGDAAVVDHLSTSPLYLSDLIYRIHVEHMDHGMVSAALRTSMNRQEVGILARGTSGSMPKLRGSDLAGMVVPWVPRLQQTAQSKSEIEQRANRDRQQSELLNSIELLTEYKSSLITAAVTGELDVTTAGSNIPG